MTPAALALLAAVAVGAGAARQHVAASAEDPHGAVDPRLVLRLVRRRAWLAGIGLSIGGYVLQAAAIAGGRLVVVEPLLATHVLFGLVASARYHRLRLGRRDLAGVAATIVGVSGFLVVAAPTTAPDPTELAPWWLPLSLVGAACATGAVIAHRLVGPRRALTLALVAGLAFGCSDALIKSISDAAGSGLAALASHWSLWAWLVVSPVGFLFQQSAYHASHLGAALPGTSSLQPAVAAVLGALMFGEQVRAGWAVPVEVAMIALILTGVVVLAASPLNEGRPSIEASMAG